MNLQTQPHEISNFKHRCHPCKIIWPDIATFVRVRERDAVLIRVDMSKEPELARDYNVADESKIILFKDGIMVSGLWDIYVQGDHLCSSKPIVEFKTKVAF